MPLNHTQAKHDSIFSAVNSSVKTSTSQLIGSVKNPHKIHSSHPEYTENKKAS